jgi:Zn-dependent metalloprotease
MKKYLLYFLIFITSVNLYSQVPRGALTYGTTNNAKFIVFDERLPRSTNASEILIANLQLNQDAQYVLTQEIIDKLGRKHEKYQQYYKGIKVNTGTYIVHYDLDGTIGAINGNYYPVDQFNINPILGETEALSEALIAVSAQEYAWQNPQMEQWIRATSKDSLATFSPTGELMVYPIIDSLDTTTYHLCYQFNIVSSHPFASEVITIDAVTGILINQFSTFSSAVGTACTNYSGTTLAIETKENTSTSNFELQDITKGDGIFTRNINGGSNPLTSNVTVFEDANNDWTCGEWANPAKDNVALDAHWAAMMTYDYFKQVHNRDSYDGQGSVLDVYVHYADNVNAVWLGTNIMSGNVMGMAFGDGDIPNFDALVSLDIVAHEFAHGVTQFSSNLAVKEGMHIAKREAAAINEALSDIWGAVVEDWVLSDPMYTDPEGDKDAWLLGEEIYSNTPTVDAQRSMSEPKGFPSFSVAEPMADTYDGFNFIGQRGISGVMSHWFYLLSEGSAATDMENDFGTTFNFNGIGIAAAADIIYLAQTVYFTELTNYRDARQATLQSAKDLYGSCSTEAQTVSEAWDAVGVPFFLLLPIFEACGEFDENDQSTGVYDGTGYSNLVVATISTGELYSGVNSFCISPNYTEIVVGNGAVAVFKASNKVVLEEGFKAEPGSTFKAYTFDCLGAGNYRLDDSGSGEENNQQIETKAGVNDESSKLTIFPNPTTGSFTLKLQDIKGEVFVEVLNLMGKKVFNQAILAKNKLIDISNQPKGIYLVRVTNGNETFTQKIVYQ